MSGVKKCTCPMWSMGGPAGSCDKPAYGDKIPGKVHRRWDGYLYRTDGRYTGYVPGAACPAHGGPDLTVEKDGDAWCAKFPDFIDLQQSPAGFGNTPEAAKAELLAGSKP